MNLLSTGPVWLFIVFGVVVALLPDILIGVWEAYSAGEGVLVNQVKPHYPLSFFLYFLCPSLRGINFFAKTFLTKKKNKTNNRLTLTLPIN